MIEVTGFSIIDYGDPSVGLLKREWELKGEFLFENKLELELFRREIRYIYFETFDASVVVKTFEEIETEERKLINK